LSTENAKDYQKLRGVALSNISSTKSDIVIPYAWNKEFVDQEIFFLKIFMIVD
jgi:hypothetical protein